MADQNLISTRQKNVPDETWLHAELAVALKQCLEGHSKRECA